jgi:hypothetical protein
MDREQKAFLIIFGAAGAASAPPVTNAAFAASLQANKHAASGEPLVRAEMGMPFSMLDYHTPNRCKPLPASCC